MNGKKNFILGITLVVCLIMITDLHADPIRTISDLQTITFWEMTNDLYTHIFDKDSSQMTNQLNDPLNAGNNDFVGVVGEEFYDVYYSNADGTFNLDGEYLTISCDFDYPSPRKGGLNLVNVGLNFTSQPTEYGNYIASFVAIGNNAYPGSVGNAIDGDLTTFTIMGNTFGQSERLHVTLGFPSSSGIPTNIIPVPGAALLGMLGLSFAGWRLRRCREL
jgi:hypothetical protein